MIPVSACSRLLGTLRAMPSIGVQGLSQQNSALLQRVSIQQQRLYSASSAGRSGRGFEEHRARFSTSPIRSFVKFSAGVGIASYCLYECSEAFGLEERLYSAIKNKRWDEAASLMNRYELSAKCREEFFLLAISHGGYDFVEPYLEKYEWSTEFIEKFSYRAAKNKRGYKFIKFFIETGKLSSQKLFYPPAFEPECKASDMQPNPAYEDSLLYTVIINGIKGPRSARNVSEETWDFVEYLLGKGANFLQKEAGSQERGLYGRTTGGKCLEMLFILRCSRGDIRLFIQISNGNLGPDAITVLEKVKSVFEEKLKNPSLCEETYLEYIQMLDGFIKKLSKQSDRIQE